MGLTPAESPSLIPPPPPAASCPNLAGLQAAFQTHCFPLLSLCTGFALCWELLFPSFLPGKPFML